MCECVSVCYSGYTSTLLYLPLPHERFSLLILEVSWKLKKTRKRSKGHTVCLELPLVSDSSMTS